MTFRMQWAAAAAAALLSMGAQAVTVHTSDFIADGSRTGFNGFENIPNDGVFFTGGAGPYAEGGISVQQINSNGGNPIWVTYRSPVGGEGQYGWYPNGGDNGYTSIQLAGGADFSSVGLLVSSGFVGSPTTVAYELWDNGNLVQAGTVAASGAAFSYLGFSGGGFDTILLADGIGNQPGLQVRDGHYNALTIDAIEITGAVPEPSTYALMALGLAAVGGLARRRRA